MTNDRSFNDGVLETVITEKALRLAHEAAEPIIDEAVHGLSNSVKDLYKRAKKAGVVQDRESCRIASELREKREHNTIEERCSTSCVQTTIFDYGV